jgi:MFS transporter, ACS family, pantothenate transporter
VLFPTYDAPHYQYAYQILILFGGLAIIGVFVLEYLHKRELYVSFLRLANWKTD